MTRALMLSAIAALALGGTAVWAAGQGKGMMKGAHAPMMQFDEIDANGDGTVTREEITAGIEARFDKADTNGDGTLTAEEMAAQMAERMQARMEARAQRMITVRDANGDGVLSADEMGSPTPEGRMMARFDTDGDGAISKEEFDSAPMSRGGYGGKRYHHRMDGKMGGGMRQDCNR